MHKKVASQIKYKSKTVTVREDLVLLSNGREKSYEILKLPEGVIILPLTYDKKIVLIREYRYNHGWVYGIPMGKQEQGETCALEAAKRELLEEVGLLATRWTHLSTHHNGIHEEGLNHFYLAEDLIVSETALDTDEQIEALEVTFEDAFRFMEEGKIVDLRSRGCIWAGYVYLLRREGLQL